MSDAEMLPSANAPKRRLRYLLALVAVPAICGVLGNWVIFHLFGNGTFLPAGSTGAHVLHWWAAAGRGIVAGVLSLLVMVAARARVAVALSTAIGSALLAYLFWLAGGLVALSLNPGALN